MYILRKRKKCPCIAHLTLMVARKPKNAPSSNIPVVNASSETSVLRRTGRAKVNSSAYLEQDPGSDDLEEKNDESSSEAETDSKENVPEAVKNVVVPSKRGKKPKISIPVKAFIPSLQENFRSVFGIEDVGEEENSGLIVEMNRYYPFPMKVDAPENRNLLFLRVKNAQDARYDREEVEVDYIKKFTENDHSYAYLDLDPLVMLKANSDTIPNNSSTNFLLRLGSEYRDNNLRDGYVHVNKHLTRKWGSLADTFDYPEAVIPVGFSLTLRDYQLRSVSWMQSVENMELTDENRINNNIYHQGIRYDENDLEKKAHQIKIKLGDSGYYICPSTEKITKSPAVAPIKPFRVRGGILADDTGSGKTITCLALIHSAPLTTELAKWRLTSLNISPANYIPSRASCIICPSNLHDQWIKEAKRCNPNFKVVGLSCIRDHEKVSWRDVMMADVLIISYQFLTNANYIKFLGTCFSTTRDLVIELDEILDVKGKVDLRHINFYRVFFDEMHEMGHKTAKCKKVASQFKADFYWGITGTPPKFENVEDLSDLLPYLNLSSKESDILYRNKVAKVEFLKKFVKRNVPDLQLPEMLTETIWVTATPSELALMNMMTEQGNEKDRIMMCSHYQICERIANIAGESFKTIEEVKTMILDANLSELARLQAGLDQKIREMESLTKEKENLTGIEKLIDKEKESANEIEKERETPNEIEMVTAANKIEIENSLKAINTKIYILQVDIKSATLSFKSCESKCNYFRSVFELLAKPVKTEDDESNECLICREQIPPNCLSILPCAHVYCHTCISGVIHKRPACPLCQKPVNPSKDILRIGLIPEAVEIQSGEDLSDIDTSKYGSKLIALYTYLRQLIRTDPTARIILFIQYRVLTEFISKTLNELNIQHVRVTGNIFKRKNSIASFKTSTGNRVVILSSEDSVSGINLTEATHVILLHPFWTGKGEEVDLAFEKQGISRAYRGGLEHPLKVIRFAVRGTIDEEITNRRQNVHENGRSLTIN